MSGDSPTGRPREEEVRKNGRQKERGGSKDGVRERMALLAGETGYIAREGGRKKESESEFDRGTRERKTDG